MRVSALMMECADTQRNFGQALASYRDSLNDVLIRQKDVNTILRDRQILVDRVLRLSQERPSDKKHEKHAEKLDAASKELGACETALKQEEAVLSGVKARVLQQAMGMRLRAQEDLGLLWQDTAREAMELLDQFDMEAITSPNRSRPWSPAAAANSPLASPVPDRQALSPANGHSALPHDIPPLNGYDDEEQDFMEPPAPQHHSRQRTDSAVRRGMMDVPPTVMEEDQPGVGSSDEDQEPSQLVAHRNDNNNNRQQGGRGHSRGPSSDFEGTDMTGNSKGSPSKKKGLFGSLGRLFKPREGDDGKPGSASKKSKQQKGWNTSIDKHVAQETAQNKLAASKERPWSPSRGRRGSDSSDDEPDKRTLKKVVNKNRPPLWMPDPTQDMRPTVTKPKKTKKRSDSFSGSTAPNFSLPMYEKPRRAMSDSGIADNLEPAQPKKVKKKSTKATGTTSPGMSRSPSAASAQPTVTTPTQKKSKRASAMPGSADTWQPKNSPSMPTETPSLLSVVSDHGDAGASPLATRKFLTGAPNEGMKRSKSTKSVSSKKRPVSVAESTPAKPRTEVKTPTSGATADLTTLALPNAAAYRNARQSGVTGAPTDDLNTLALPSASASRAFVAGSTLSLPTAPPPVSSMPQYHQQQQHLQVPEATEHASRPQMKRSASSASSNRKSGSKRASSAGLRPEPALLAQQHAPAPAPAPAQPPASPRGRTESMPAKAKPNGILHSPNSARSLSPVSTMSRRKSVRIQEDGDRPFPSLDDSLPSATVGDNYASSNKGKLRASEDEITNWGQEPRRRRGNESSDEEDDDIDMYRSVSVLELPVFSLPA